MAGALLVVALLSKESAFAAFAMLPMLVLAARLGRGDALLASILATIRLLLPFVGLAVLVFVARWSVLGGMGGAPDNSDLLVIDFDKYGQIVGAFTRDLLWPFAALASSTREIWQRLAAALLLGLAIGIACLPRRPAFRRAGGPAVGGGFWSLLRGLENRHDRLAGLLQPGRPGLAVRRRT